MENKEIAKDKAVTVRIPIELYNLFLERTLERSNKEKRMVKISEIMREAMENGR